MQKVAPTKQNCAHVALLRKPIGNRGGIALEWRNPFSLENARIEHQDFIFLEIDALLVPFQIADYEERNPQTLIVVLEHVDSLEKAKAIAGANVYIYADAIEKTSLQNSAIERLDFQALLEGRCVTDQNGVNIGRINEVHSFSLNVVLEVSTAEGESVMIPFAEELVIQWPDWEKPPQESPIQMVVPEELFNL